MPTNTSIFVVPLDQLSLADLPRVGGKNASLGEMIGALRTAGVNVPGGFAVTTDAFRQHLRQNDIETLIHTDLDGLNVDDTRRLARVAGDIRQRIHHAPLPAVVRAEIMRAYGELSAKHDDRAIDVAVRSSATAEDLPTASFAGQQDTYLFVHGEAAISMRPFVPAWRRSSLIAPSCIATEQGIPHRGVSLSVGVQKMVRSDLASAPV